MCAMLLFVGMVLLSGYPNNIGRFWVGSVAIKMRGLIITTRRFTMENATNKPMNLYSFCLPVLMQAGLGISLTTISAR